MKRTSTLLFPALLAAGAAFAAEPVDNCATMLGSLAVELRHARALPPGKYSKFTCPRRFHPLLGASRDRIFRSLGTPDTTAADGAWSYFFASHHVAREPGTVELVFRYDGDAVNAIDCRRTR